MFGRRMLKAENTPDCINKLRETLDNADAIVIGAGAGLSTSAGFVYAGERFERYFSDFAAKYGFYDMYSGGFYPYSTLEEHWTYWSRYIYINRYMNVQDRLPYRSDYLDGHAECAVSLVSSPGGEPEVIRAYPQGAEREAINAVFDEIVADLKLEHIFTHSEQPLSLAESERPSVLGQLAAGKQQQKPAPETAKTKSEPEI